MIIDCHYHLDDEMLSLDKTIEAMDLNGIDKTVLIARIVPPIYGPFSSKEERLSSLFRQMLLHVNPLGRAIYRSLVEGDNWKGHWL